jgi:hypothetical protein
MSFSTSSAETFQEKVCRHFDVPPERYGALVLSCTLYPHARWLRPLGSNEFLAPDRAFITAVGSLTRWRDFSGAAWDFQHDARNRRFTRRVLRLRVSVGRMRVLFSEVWGGAVPIGLEDLRNPSAAGPGSLLIH